MGISPASYETNKLKSYVKEFPPAAVARDQLEFATAELATYQAGRIRKSLDDAIQATLIGSKTAEEALGEAQATAEKILKSYR
jgi:sn-glycerol 3-phosphate transport system substrate-binding protein